MRVLAEESPGRGREVGCREREAVVLVDMGTVVRPVVGLVILESEAVPLLRFEVIEPADESVDVSGMATPPLALCARAKTSDMEAGEPLRGNPSIVDEDEAFGDVTRETGAAEDEEDPGLEDPFMLLMDADASDAAVLGRFLVAAALSAPTLLEDASSGINGMPAERSCG